MDRRHSAISYAEGPFRLGIDAGGSFTDAVLLDDRGAVAAWAKAPTTPRDPSLGISQALAALPPALIPKVALVGLATTFATNALVEGRGASAGLILIGHDLTLPGLPQRPPVLGVAGGHDYWGEEVRPLDRAALGAGLGRFLTGLEAVAVVGLFSVRNPAHELEVAEAVAKRSNLPVVCGHRLSSRLDIGVRAATAWWNARLIPLLTGLVQATQAVLDRFGVGAPFMVVRGDGTLMSAATARQRPVETLLSGPAASVLGASHLSGLVDGLVVDMGGTTTDMALLAGGRVALAEEGARVGAWRTHAEAARIRTVGLGGDSLITFRSGMVEVGPRRVEPLCALAAREPRVTSRLRATAGHHLSTRRGNPSAVWVAAGPAGQLPEELRRGPLSEAFLLEDDRRTTSLGELERLEEQGLVLHGALTPTDLRVAAGEFALGDAEASRAGLVLWARHARLTVEAFGEAVEEEIRRRLCTEAVAFVQPDWGPELSRLWSSWFPAAPGEASGPLRVHLHLTEPVLGGGAPAGAFLPGAFRRLGGRCLLPEPFAVSTAVGAVVGAAEVTLRGEVHPRPAGSCILYTPGGRREFPDPGGAVAEGRRLLEGLARARLGADGICDPVFHFRAEESTVPLGGGSGQFLVRIDLTLTASGRVDLASRKGSSGDQA